MRGVMTIGTALASVVFLLGVATACGDGDDGSATTGDPPPVPKELADGTTPVPMPDGLRRFRGRPVIQAKELPGQAGEILCPPDRSREGRTSPAGSWISTEGLSVGYLIRGTTELYTCDAAFVDGNWEPCSSKSLTASSAEEFVERESASTCEEPEPARSYLWVVVPSQRVAWTLVDHRSFWVGYLSANRPLVRISNVGEEFNSTVAFVDQQGGVIEERQIEDGKPV